MDIPEHQYKVIWRAIKHWMEIFHLSSHFLSLQTAGLHESYSPARIVKGIENGSERITSDFLHACVRIFGLTSARQRGLNDHLTDEECIGLLIAPLMNNKQGTFEF